MCPKCGTHKLILREVHGGSMVGHFGEDKTYFIAKEHYYWPHMLKDIQDIIKRCSTCQVAKKKAIPFLMACTHHFLPSRTVVGC